MKINSANTYHTTNDKKQVSSKGARHFVRTLANPDALASTILLEGAVTGGRGYNAYKRGGINELRERAIDDILAAIFWMKGVDIFNSIGNKFGEKVLKLPTTDFDMGKDALRKPFENVAKDLSKMGVSKNNVAQMQKKLARFKLIKIISASLLSTAFVGFALPKINQGITKMFMSKDTAKKVKDGNNPQPTKYTNFGYSSFEDFDKKISSKKSPSFKGKMELVAHYLENNKICKLLTSDVGITTGRVVSARNKDEGLEYLFRDAASCIFYTASTPAFYKLFQYLDPNKGTTSIDPVAAKQLNEHLIAELKKSGGKMNTKDFGRKTLGALNETTNTIFKNLNFTDDVISIRDFGKLLRNKEFIKTLNLADDSTVLDDLLKKAIAMSKLQPSQAGIGNVLTKQQVLDVLKDGSINTPEFMNSLYKEHFGEKLTNRYRFIPMKKITNFRDNIDDYINAVIKAANKKDGIVTEEILKKVNKSGFIKSALFRGVAIGISALALGIAIPKAQYAITKYRTGSDAAPGLREYEQKEEKKI